MPAPNRLDKSYDATPYPDLAYSQTHPDRLATLGHILGLQPADVTNCRVLELGCAGGGNLLPMAVNLPQSQFTGVDYSTHQIELGARRGQAIGAQNLHLLRLDVSDRNAAQQLEGPFDYIIAHGLYSWVAKPVRDAFLGLCRQVLAPTGILYVSYNTLPGWNLTRTLREAMLFHARNATSPQEKVKQAKEMIAFLGKHIPDEHEAYRSIFRQYEVVLNEGLKGSSEAFLLHDELEDVNDPLYFQDFVDHAAQFGLRYFVEAELASVLPHVFGGEVMAQLQGMATSSIELEQYMDFLRNRMFRQSLLCHAAVEPTRVLRPEPLMQLYARSNATTHRESGQAGVVNIRATGGATLTTDHPLSHAAFDVLRRNWPRALHFDELASAAARVAGVQSASTGQPVPPDRDRLMLAANLLRGYGHSTGLVNLHSYAPRVAVRAGDRPQAAGVARFEAQSRNTVTNVWHERVQLDESKRQLLLLLDGERPLGEIGDLWQLAVANSPRRAKQTGEAGRAQAMTVEDELAWLGRASLLVA